MPIPRGTHWLRADVFILKFRSGQDDSGTEAVTLRAPNEDHECG